MKGIIISILILICSGALAQHDHSSHSHGNDIEPAHKIDTPHGGEIKDVGKYHLEIVFEIATSNENMSIYVLKSNMKQADIKGATGKMNIKYKNGTEETYELTNNSIDKLFCNIKDVVNPFNAMIRINYKGKEYNTTYAYKGMK
ncbi:MAG: hypothetical protein JNL24_05825 [Bacteroidia bacterium]|nr:hypothetical protein [Bacteroidia bacterium]